LAIACQQHRGKPLLVIGEKPRCFFVARNDADWPEATDPECPSPKGRKRLTVLLAAQQIFAKQPATYKGQALRMMA
jgi:hypothetical protein